MVGGMKSTSIFRTIEREHMGNKRLSKREHEVRAILLQYPKARDDDRFLTLMYHHIFCGVDLFESYSAVMTNEHLPSQESIGRCRRKIQEHDETLRGSKSKEEIRFKEQKAFIEYALSDRSEA